MDQNLLILYKKSATEAYWFILHLSESCEERDENRQDTFKDTEELFQEHRK